MSLNVMAAKNGFLIMKALPDPFVTDIQVGNLFNSSFHQLSHELRTPLHQINGFAEILLMDPELSPANVEYVRAILSGSEQLKAAVSSHLDRAESAAAAPPIGQPVPHNPGSVGAVDPSSHSLVGVAVEGPVAGAIKRQKITSKFRRESVIGPLGQPMTLASLPPRDTKRWNAHRKAELVAAVHGGLLTIEEVCERYCIELEEFVSWQRGMDRLGLRGLWVTQSQKQRDLFARKQRF